MHNDEAGGFSAKLGSTNGWVWRSGRSKSRIKSTFFVPFWEKAPSAIRWRAGLRSVEATSRVERANLRRENIYEHCQRERERAPDSVAATRRKLGKISLGEAAKNFSTADDDCDDSACYAAMAKHPKRDIERIAGPE